MISLPRKSRMSCENSSMDCISTAHVQDYDQVLRITNSYWFYLRFLSDYTRYLLSAECGKSLLQILKILIQIYVTRLKNKIENHSTWEGAFYESEWEINSSWVIVIF